MKDKQRADFADRIFSTFALRTAADSDFFAEKIRARQWTDAQGSAPRRALHAKGALRRALRRRELSGVLGRARRMERGSEIRLWTD